MAKNTNANHVVSVEADFSNLVKAAKKAGKKSSELIGKALEAGIKTHSTNAYEKSYKEFNKRRIATERKFAANSYAAEVQRAGKVEAKLKEVVQEIAKRDRELKDQNIDYEVRKRKLAERKLFKEKCQLLDQLDKGMVVGFADALREANKELEQITIGQNQATKAQGRATDQMIRGSETAAEFMKSFRIDAIKGASEFNEKLQGSLETLKSGLSNIDIGSLASGGVSGLAKGAGSFAEMATGLAAAGGAMSGLAAGAAALAIALGPLLLIAGALGGLLFGMDKEIKEFNKSAINTFGTRSVMNVGMSTLDENLTVIRHAVQDLTSTLGLTESEAVGVFDAFDAGGISFGRFTKGAVDAADADARLSAALRGTVSIAKSLGIEVSSFAGTLAEYSDTLASSLEGVTDQFALVAKQAQDAGFSTRRFYSLITQASAGQASLNTHLDQTADLLVRMTKVLGEKAGAEVLGGAAGGLGDMSTQDRTRMVMTTGRKRTSEIVSRDADSQAHNFVSDLSRSLGSPEVARAFATASGAGVTLSDAARTDSDVLVRELSALSRSDQAVLTTAFENSTDKTVSGLGRRLDQLTKLSRGTSGELFDLTDSFSALSAGATVEMKLSSVDEITGGVPFNELSGHLRMAAESVSGMSGAQIEQYQALAAASEGSLRILQSIKSQGLPFDEAAAADQDKRFGGHIAENGEIVTASGLAVENSTDLLTAMVERGDAEVTEARNEAMDLAYDAFDATTTIADILENKILFYVRGLYEDVGQPLITWLSKSLRLGGSSSARQEAITARGALGNTSREAMDSASEAGRTISRLGSKETAGTLTAQEGDELKRAREQAEAARETLDAVSKAMRRLSSGDYSGMTGTRHVEASDRVTSSTARTMLVHTDAHDETYQMTGAEYAASIGGSSRTATASSRASEDAATAVHQPIVAATEEASETTVAQAEETRDTMKTLAEDSDRHITKTLTKDRKVGDMLAKSGLPDAIVAAQVKQQISALASAAGLTGDDAADAITQYMEEGTFSGKLSKAITGLDAVSRAALSPAVAGVGGLIGGEDALGNIGTVRGPAMLRGRGGVSGTEEVTVGPTAHDFIYQGDGVRGTLTPIDGADTVVGAKSGGPLDRGGGGGGGNVTVNVYGGDERRVFDVVKRVIQQSGLGPGRVASRA